MYKMAKRVNIYQLIASIILVVSAILGLCVNTDWELSMMLITWVIYLLSYVWGDHMVLFDGVINGFKREDTKNIKVKYFTDIPRLNKIDKGDWIDVRAAEDVVLKKGEFKLIPLGFAMELPKGYEAHVVPRSSTYKNFGIIQTNHQAVIDESYNGSNDQWFYPAYALRATEIHKGDRIAQFRIVEKQPPIEFIEVESLDNEDRGGIGSTGTN